MRLGQPGEDGGGGDSTTDILGKGLALRGFSRRSVRHAQQLYRQFREELLVQVTTGEGEEEQGGGCRCTLCGDGPGACRLGHTV